MTLKLNEKTAHELRDMLQAGETSSEEITKSIFERIEQVESKIDAYLSFDRERALEMATSADARRRTGDECSPLMGIPVSIKDVICTRGITTTCASKMLEHFVPPYDATVIERLKTEGTVFIGKTNMDEFAMGSSTERSAFKTTRNPWDTERVPGGSSGGSAAALAADEAILALGTDTGGSIRQPAAVCGIVGLKPTYGRVSRFGLVAYGSSLDQIGPMTKDVEDAALLMNVLAGHDERDSTSADVPVPDYTSFLNKDVKGMKIGVPKEYFVEGIDKDVEAALRACMKTLEDLGAKVEEVSLPHTEYAVATYYLCATAEASSNLGRYDGAHYGYRCKNAEDIVDMFSRTRAEGFGEEVKRRIMLGTYALSAGFYDAYYLKALKVRTLLKQDFEKAFEKADVIVTPTSPTAAFKIGEKMDDPLSMYLSDIYTISVNLAGIPGMSLNCGFTSNGLPIGMQILAPIFEEGRIFKVADVFQKATEFHTKKPDIG